MTRTIRAAGPAAEELAAAVRWYERQRPGLGNEFFKAVVTTLARIAGNPDAGQPLRTTSARRLLVPRFPYQIVYRPVGDEVRVLAFAHLKRRPDFWRGRR